MQKNSLPMQCVCQIELELRLRTHDLTHWTLDTDFKKYFAGILNTKQGPFSLWSS